jgi:hypothetical protein
VSGYARRDRFAVWLANQALRLASKHYRMMVRGSIIYGLRAAAGQPLLPPEKHVAAVREACARLADSAGATYPAPGAEATWDAPFGDLLRKSQPG